VRRPGFPPVLEVAVCGVEGALRVFDDGLSGGAGGKEEKALKLIPVHQIAEFDTTAAADIVDRLGHDRLSCRVKIAEGNLGSKGRHRCFSCGSA
jgi:hypothetical protein